MIEKRFLSRHSSVDIDQSLLDDNEIKLNIQNRKILDFFTLICILGCMLVFITDDSDYLKLDIVNTIFLMLAFGLIYAIGAIVKVESKAYKYCFIMWMFLPIIVEIILTSGYFWIGLALPMIFSCRYYNVRLVALVSFVTQLSVIIATLGLAFIQPLFGYARAAAVRIPQGYQVTGEGLWMSEVAADLLNSGEITRLEYIKDLFTSITLYMGIMLLCVAGGCVMITIQQIRNMESQSKMLEEKRNLDVKIAESKYRLMISQIQPHFIFNVLNSAIYLCEDDADKAQKVLMDFSTFLRHDINVLSGVGLVRFDSELESVESYLELEKVRFDDRIQTEMDIRVRDFEIPPLTLQPLVENAVRHGICKKREGGVIIIRTYEEDSYIYIMVEDNGAGFDPASINKPGENHVGLTNVKERLQYIMGADMRIESEPLKGTTITLVIPKNYKKRLVKSV